MNSPSPKIKNKKNSKGIAAATEEKFRQPLLKTFSTRCCSSCRVFESLSSQTFPLVLPALARSHALFAACSFQSRVDFFYIPWRSKASIAGKHAHNPAKTIGFPRPGSEGVEHIKPLQTQKHKDVCLKINVQQPCPGWKICHGTVTQCDEAKLARSRVWIAAPGSEAALRTVALEELAFSFMSWSFASLQHLHLERGTRRCHGRRWKTKEKMGWSQQGGAANALLAGVWVENVVRCWEKVFFFFSSPPIAIRNSCVFLLFCQDFTHSVYLEKLSSFYEPNFNHSLVRCFSHATWSELNAKTCLATSGNALWLDNWPMETSVEGLAQQMPVVGFTYSQRKPQFLAIILCMQMEAAPVNMNKCCLSAWFSD